MPDVALFAPLPASMITDTFPDLEVAEIRAGDGEPTRQAAGARIAIADWTGELRIAGAIVDALAPTCELVQVPGAGVDSVDVDACREAGIPVASCAGLNTVAVAEWIVWGTLDALKHLSQSGRALREGAWEQLGETRYELAGKTVGIVGLGSIGTAAAQRLAAFDVELLYWSRRRRDEAEEQRLGVAWRDLHELLGAVDVLVLTVALTEDTRGLIGRDELATMRPSAVLVNAARGEIVDGAALAAALEEGGLHGAAVDVFATEPPPADHPLLSAPHAAVTPHVAGTSSESVGRIIERVFGNVRRVLDGEEPEGLVA